VISGVVLAAGTSSRFGRPKQLLDLGGMPVLRHVLDAAVAGGLDEVVVVLGHVAREIVDAVPPTGRVRIASNPRYAEGQSTSLRTGLQAVDAESEAAVILLGDQPWVRPDAIAAVVRAFREGAGPVVQASYGGRPGHPTLLGRGVWEPVVAEAEGDEGARAILARHAEWVAAVEVGGTPPEDIDTEADYARLLSRMDSDSS
jgi:CTP:molybdopterin cytidylyltransferase MocA